MKNYLKFLALAAIGVLTAASCQKNELRDTNCEDLFFSLRTSDTKTYMVSNSDGSFSPNWNNGDEIGVFFEDFASDKETPAGKLSNTNDSGATAKFEGTISSAGESGTIYAFYPASALGKTYANQSVGFDMPAIQHPTATSFDPAADILVAKPVNYTAEGGNVVVENMQFARILAILKVNLNSDFADVKNQKVIKFSIKSETAVLSGRPAVTLTASDGKITVWNVKNKEVTAAYDETSTVAVAGTDNKVFLTINPNNIPSGETLTFTIETEKYIITKEVTLPGDIVFTPGNLTEIDLSIAEANCEEKVDTDYSGDYLIVSTTHLLTDYNTNKYYNFVNATGEELSDFWKIDGIGNYVWTVAKLNDGSYSFYNAFTDKYLALTENDNKAHQVDNADENTARFTITEDNSALTIYSKAYPERRLRCNTSSPRFAFYGKSSTLPVASLLAYTPDSRPTFDPVSGLSWDASGKTLSWTAAEGATNGYEYTTDNGTTVTAVDANTIDCSSWSNGDYSVKVRVVATDAKKTSEWSEACEFTISGGEAAKYYRKVTSLLENYEGTFLILGTGTTYAFTGTGSGWGAYSTVTVDNEKGIKSNSTVDAYAVTISKLQNGNYTIQAGNDSYIASVSSNTFSMGSSAGEFTFEYDNCSKVKLTNGRYMKFVSGSGFRMYSSATGVFSDLYKLDEVAVTSLAVSGTPTKKSYSVGESFDPDGLVATATYADASQKDITSSVEWTVTPETLSAGTTSVKVVATYKGITSNEYVVNGLSVKALSSISVKTAPTKVVYTEGEKFDPTGLVITRNYSDATSDEYAYADHEDDFTFDPELTSALSTSNTSITITYSGKSVSQKITVNEVPALSTMDAIFAAATEAGSSAKDAKVKFDSWVVSGVKNNNAYLTDNNGKGLIIYASGHNFAVGDVLSGTVNCKVQLYNGAAELTSLTSTTEGLAVTKGGTITPATIAIANLSGVNTGAVITFESLQYNGTDFTDGANTIKPYNTFITLPSLTSGRNYKVTGVYIQYKETKEIAPRSTEDIVLLSGPYLNASASKTSGIAAAGETVTITVDTNIDGWTVSSDNTAFVVGAKDGNTVPVVVSENTSTTDGRTAKITVSAAGVDPVVITLTQSKKSSGEGPAVGTVLWGENFAHFGTKTPSDAKTGTGTTIYGEATITYSQSSTNTKGYNDTFAGGTAPELLLSKNNQTWTISGIPCNGASEMSLKFLSNKTTFDVSSTTTGIKVEGSQTTWTIKNTSASTFTLVIKNTGTSNARIDNVVLKVTAN